MCPQGRVRQSSLQVDVRDGLPRSHAALSTAHQSHAVAVAHATALLLAGHVVAVAAPPGSEALGMLEAATAGAMEMARERLERIERMEFLWVLELVSSVSNWKHSWNLRIISLSTSN